MIKKGDFTKWLYVTLLSARLRKESLILALKSNWLAVIRKLSSLIEQSNSSPRWLKLYREVTLLCGLVCFSFSVLLLVLFLAPLSALLKSDWRFAVVTLIKCALCVLGAFFVGYMCGRSIGWWDHAEYIESIKKGELL